MSECFDLFCPKCNIMVETKTILSGNTGFYNNRDESPMIDEEYSGDIYLVSLCKRCNQPFLIQQHLYGVGGEFETITEENLLYPCSNNSLVKSLPDQIKKAYEDAKNSFGASIYQASALMCRRVIEIVCKLHNAEGHSLYKKLEYLENNRIIDSKLLQWAHAIRNLGNDAAHDLDYIASKEDAKDILDLTEAILLYVYSLNELFEKYEERRKS